MFLLHKNPVKTPNKRKPLSFFLGKLDFMSGWPRPLKSNTSGKCTDVNNCISKKTESHISKCIVPPQIRGLVFRKALNLKNHYIKKNTPDILKYSNGNIKQAAK